MALSLVGFAFANHIIKLLGGGKIEQGKTIFGEDFVSISTGIVHAPVKVEGEEIYFILDGQNINITDQCTDSSFYKYEKTDDNGYRHVVVIGGTFDNVGVGEFIWDEMDNFIGSNASFNSHEEPEWLKSAEIELRKQ